MGITFAGVDLLLSDQAGRADEWLARYLSLPDSRMILEWPTPKSSWTGTSAYYTGAELPCPNWSKPLEPKLSTWYRPTGASRWSMGFFLADYPRVQQIQTATAGNQSATLTLTSKAKGQVQRRSWSQCYLLPPHPISADAFTANGLWILPVVDERWFWQSSTNYVTPIDTTTPTAESWSQALIGTATALGATLTVDTVPSTYLYPNFFVQSGTSWHNSAIMLDALAYSVGQRIVPNYGAYGANTSFAGGQWISQGWDNARSRRNANLSLAYDIGGIQAGSVTTFPQQAALAPANIEVVFRAYKNGIVVHDWKATRYVSTVSAATAGWTGSTTAAFTATILSTALADASISGNSTNPDNKTSLDNLALQVATDYYNFWIQDSNVVGVSQWQESGYDDYVEFNCGERLEDGSYVSKTRIHSTPYNQSTDAMLHYDSTTWEYGDKIWGTLDGDLTANGTQTITVTGCDGAIPGGTNHVKVTEVMGVKIFSGMKVVALRRGDIWAVLDATGGIPAVLGIGQCATLVVNGAQGNFVLSSGPTIASTVTNGITLAAKNYLIAMGDDGIAYVVNPDMILYGQFAACTKAGSSGTLTIYTGTLGAEASSGITVSAYVRRGACVTGRTYIVGVTTGGYEVLNPDGMLLGQCSTATDCTSGATATFAIFSGSQGSESTQSVTTSVYVRKGFIHANKTYIIGQVNNGFEVVNPTTHIRGQPGSDIASDANGSMVVYAGSGAGSSTGVTVSSIRNDTSCIVKGSKNAGAIFNDDAPGWAFDYFHST